MKLQIFSKHSATCALVGLEKRSAYRRSSAPSQTFKRPDIRFSATETVSDQSVPEGRAPDPLSLCCLYSILWFKIKANVVQTSLEPTGYF